MTSNILTKVMRAKHGHGMNDIKGRTNKIYRKYFYQRCMLEMSVTFILLFFVAPIHCLSECEKAAYVGLTHEQKLLLCSDNKGAYTHTGIDVQLMKQCL